MNSSNTIHKTSESSVVLQEANPFYLSEPSKEESDPSSIKAATTPIRGSTFFSNFLFFLCGNSNEARELSKVFEENNKNAKQIQLPTQKDCKPGDNYLFGRTYDLDG